MMPPLLELFVGTLLLLALSLLGYLFQVRVGLGECRPRAVVASFPLGSGLFTAILFIFSWIGLPLNPLSVAGLYGGLILLLTLTSRREQLQNSLVPPRHLMTWFTSRGAWFYILWGVLGLTLLIIATISVGRSYSSWDGASQYAVKGYAIASSQSVDAVKQWGMWGPAYPLNIMLQISLFKMFAGEALPASKLIFPLYLFAGMLGAYRFWRRMGVEGVVAALGTLFVATNPVLYVQSSNGYADAALASILLLGVTSIVEGYLEGRGDVQLLGGVLLGIGVWTRPEGLFYAGLIVFSMTVVDRMSGSNRIKLLEVAAPIIFFSGWLGFPWSSGSIGQLGDSIQAGSAVSNLLQTYSQGAINLRQLLLIPTLFFQRAIKPENWGAFLPILAVLGGVGLLVNQRWNDLPPIRLLFASAIAACVVPFGLYYLISFDPYYDFELILRSAFDRMFLSPYLLLILAAVSLWAEGGSGARLTSGPAKDQSKLDVSEA